MYKSFKKFTTSIQDEASTRRKRSESLVKKKKVPCNKYLPVIETEEQSKRRPMEEVALRAIAICIIAVKGEGIDQKLVEDWIDKYQITPVFTPQEEKFIHDLNPSERDRIQFAWQFECLWVMLWALSYVDELGYPDRACDAGVAVKMIHGRGREKFLENANLRPQNQILDEADLIYRYHWAVRDAQINGREIPGGLNCDVVMERHRALNWLIGYAEAEWDEVTTDT